LFLSGCAITSASPASTIRNTRGQSISHMAQLIQPARSMVTFIELIPFFTPHDITLLLYNSLTVHYGGNDI
jgi:hypothetical protein